MKKTSNVFTACALFFSLAVLQAEAQSWYGQLRFPHGSTILTSAKRTINNPGYIMAGYRPGRQVGSSNADFVTDKVNAAGAFAGSNFSMEYQIRVDGVFTAGLPGAT